MKSTNYIQLLKRLVSAAFHYRASLLIPEPVAENRGLSSFPGKQYGSFRVFSALMMFAYADPVRAEWVEWLFNSGLSFRTKDNINQSFFSGQHQEDYFWSGFLSGGRAYQLDDYTRIYLNSGFTGDLHHRFQELDQYTLGGNATLTHKFGLGWQAPQLNMTVSGDEIFSSSKLRNGEKIISSLRFSKWLHERIQAQAGYRFDYRNGPQLQREIPTIPSNVFDLHGHSIDAALNFSVTETLRFNVSYAWRWGDIVSNNLPTSVSPEITNRVHALVEDDVFPGWLYSAYGTTQTYDAGLSYAFWEGYALIALSYQHVETQALGLNYQSNQVHLGFNYSN
ncbi:MAG: hypothetical protein PHD43_13185 [Methylococcales bacterium]|nr:hypothetical protein [Methylococcales bacterium]